MNELRWILVGIGAVLLALIYFFSRRTADVDDDELRSPEQRLEPSLSRDDVAEYSEPPEQTVDADDEREALPSGRFADVEEVPVVDLGASSAQEIPTLRKQPQAEPAASSVDDVADSTPDSSPENESAPVVPEKVIALHLMPKAGEMFSAIDFVGAVQAEGLKFGRFDIFHRFADPDTANDNTPALFSLANMIKPGTFSLLDLEKQQFKGASMFLVLPGPDDAVAAFADMLATGRRLAVTLDGQLLDSHGTQLSRQSASHLREDIINYQHGLSPAPAE